MRRFWCGLVLLLVIISTMAPSIALLQFNLRRAYIARELCVQREVAAEMRTCHGECHLARQLRALEQESDEGFPGSQIDFRTEPALEPAHAAEAHKAPAVMIRFASLEQVLPTGFITSIDPVPWA